MPRTNILVVVVDGLRASALGAYGNTTFSTPALDEFAAESVLFDWCYGASVDLEGIYSSLLYSQHPARTMNGVRDAHDEKPSTDTLPNLMAAAGYRTVLVTDEPELESFIDSDAFHQHVHVTSAPTSFASTRRANDEFQTALARVFAATNEVIGSANTRAGVPQLVWVHARGMYGAWDAPLDFQNALRDEGDPPPLEGTAGPDDIASMGGDPDAVFQYSCAYAAQVMVLDACWRRLLETINGYSVGAPWLIVLLGGRGYPLGEHGIIGGIDERLYAEQSHVPWLIQLPDGRGRLSRVSRLVTHLDLLPTLTDWIREVAGATVGRSDGLTPLPSPYDAQEPGRDAILSVTSNDNYAIRSANWCLRGTLGQLTDATAASAMDGAELFVRPDDRWEANDVSKLCPHEIDELRVVASEMLRQYVSDERC